MLLPSKILKMRGFVVKIRCIYKGKLLFHSPTNSLIKLRCIAKKYRDMLNGGTTLRTSFWADLLAPASSRMDAILEKPCQQAVCRGVSKFYDRLDLDYVPYTYITI